MHLVGASHGFRSRETIVFILILVSESILLLEFCILTTDCSVGI